MEPNSVASCAKLYICTLCICWELAVTYYVCNTTLRCFKSEMFTFVVIWNEIGSGTSTNVTTSSSPYNISGLQPGTSYQISVQGVGGSGVVGGTTVLNVATSGEWNSLYSPVYLIVHTCTSYWYVQVVFL